MKRAARLTGAGLGGALRGKGNLAEAIATCSFHHRDDRLVRGAGIGADDDHAVFAVAGRQHEGCAKGLDAAAFNGRLVYHIAAIAADCHDDFFWIVALLFGVRQRELDLQLRELAVSGGQHQKNQYHQQHVNKGDQVDLRLIAGASAEVHDGIPVGSRDFSPGRPKKKCAPLGGSDVREATSMGALFIFAVC